MNIRVLLIGTILISAYAKADIIGPLVEGATTIKGGGATAGDIIQFVDGNGAVVPTTGSVAAAADGTFSATLKTALVSGQQIKAQQSKPPSAAPWADLGPLTTVVGIADWGRVRATFAAGTVLSADNSFQGQSTTVAREYAITAGFQQDLANLETYQFVINAKDQM